MKTVLTWILFSGPALTKVFPERPTFRVEPTKMKMKCRDPEVMHLGSILQVCVCSLDTEEVLGW